MRAATAMLSCAAPAESDREWKRMSPDLTEQDTVPAGPSHMKRLTNSPAWSSISKVSTLGDLLCRSTIESTFQNVCLSPVTGYLRSRIRKRPLSTDVM